jgi:hypothetical protein
MPKDIYPINARNALRNKEIIRLRETQYTFGEIANKIKCTRATVAGVLHRHYKGYKYLSHG